MIELGYNRKPFTTTIDEQVQNKFKSKCTEQGIKMNDVLEVFMKMYTDGKFEMVLRLNENKIVNKKSQYVLPAKYNQKKLKKQIKS